MRGFNLHKEIKKKLADESLSLGMDISEIEELEVTS